MSDTPSTGESQGDAPPLHEHEHERTVAEALQAARLGGVARLDSHLLLAALLNRPRSWLLAHDQDPLPAELHQRFGELSARRARGEPLAYLLGSKDFYGLDLQVDSNVLVPRPDTETLVDWALELIPGAPDDASPWDVLDLGTGSGAIALAIQSRRPRQARVTAVDASPAALAVACANARRLSLPIRNLPGSWFEPVAGQRFDLVVSNPPYIADDDPHMAALAFEPRQALTAGPEGLDDIRAIVAGAQMHLKPGGWLLLEHGYNQADQVVNLLTEHGFIQVATRRDLGGQDRCTGGQTRV